MRALNQVLTLTLCAALILPAPAHCQLTDLSDETYCGVNPIIFVSSDNETLKINYNSVFDSAYKRNNVSIPFGSSVKVRCKSARSGGTALTLTRDGQNLFTEKYRYQIRWSTGKLNLLKSQYKYECTDVVTTCNRSVITLVTPGLEVISANLQISVQDNGHTNYIVQYGESMSVQCFGPDAARLVMSRDGQTLLTERESDAIKRFEKKPLDLQISEFVCTDVDTTYNRSATIRVVPRIYFQSRNETIVPSYAYLNEQDDNLVVYYFDYSDSIEMYCSGPRAMKLIPLGGEDTSLRTENCNSNTVKYTQKIKLGTSDFRCTASDFSDYVANVRVILKPRMEVKSPLILRVGSTRGVIQYTIKYGAPLEIICSETDAAQLSIRYNYLLNCTTQIVNATAIKCLLEQVNDEEKMLIQCYRLSDLYGRGLASVRVGVLPPDDVVDFRCVSHNMEYLNCSWTTPSHLLNFTLSIVENGILTNMCKKRPSLVQSKLCVWEFDLEYRRNEMEVLTLILQWCNNVGCSNQTFHIDHMSIVRPAPPLALELLNTTAHGAVLQWSGGLSRDIGGIWEILGGPLQHKGHYWYSGIEPRALNSSLVLCEYRTCQIALNLPCPGMFYQVWIYHKPQSAGEEFWSEPARVSFHTAVVEKNGDNSMNDDPSCTWKPKKNSEVMKYFVGELKRDVHLEMQTLKEKVSSLKDKLAAVQAYLKQRGKGTN